MAREKIDLLIDKNKPSVELMSLAGLRHEGGFGAGGTTVVVLAYVSGVLCLINANVATRKAGAIDYATSLKNLRLSQIASENKLLTINLVESGGANLPDQDRVFNNYGKFFMEMSQRSKEGVPSISVVFGNATAGGAYVPGMSDYTIMQKNNAKVFLAGPPLVKMATNEDANDEELGGALMHSSISGVSDFLADDEKHAIKIARDLVSKISPLKSKHNDFEKNALMPRFVEDELLGIIPSNPIKAMADGNMLQIIVFSILFGIAIRSLGDSVKIIKDAVNSITEIVLKLVMFIINIAPYGVFCLMSVLFAEKGLTVLGDLSFYFFIVVSALLLHGLLTYSLFLILFVKVNPFKFFNKIKSLMLFAFSTSSSNATIPETLKTVVDNIGVNRKIASFTVPLGATINMDGTAIMQGVATVFIANAYSIDLLFVDYLMVILTATLASIGTAGVPGVGLIMLAMVLNQVGLPVEGIALIIGVDRLLDMLRTVVNVTGDSTVSTIVANSENQLERTKL